MAWIELHQSLPTHRKTLALADALSIEPVQAVGHLACLWMWTLDNAPHGALLDVSSKTIARAAHWRKDATAFVLALVDAGFLDQDQHVHDWEDYAGRLLQERARNKLRMRDTRAAHVQRTSDSRAPATVPNRTQPNPTVPDLTKDEDPPSPPRGKRAKPAHEVLSQAERTDLIIKWQDQYGGMANVADEIDAALNHTAHLKYQNERLYVDRWLHKELSLRPGRRNGQVGAAVFERPTVSAAAEPAVCRCVEVQAELASDPKTYPFCGVHGRVQAA